MPSACDKLGHGYCSHKDALATVRQVCLIYSLRSLHELAARQLGDLALASEAATSATSMITLPAAYSDQSYV